MNSRGTPWRQKPTQEIQNMIPLAMETRLYLLQEIGPTSFVFKDDNDNKLRIMIGKEVTCSCNPHKKDQCVHTLYVFLKIFQFEVDNPLIWQTSYIDSEINDFIRNRYNPKPQKPKKVLPSIKKRSVSVNAQGRNQNTVNRIEIDENDVCCICHEGMKEEEGLTYCKKKCGNNFHLKCISIWAEHKNTTGDKMNCPMCRTDWGIRALENIKEEMDEFESRLILHKGHKCSACKSYGQKWIKGKRFHCMYCENFELCEKCFLSFEHFEHNKYLVKENIKDNWKPAKSRESVYLKTNNKQYQFIKDFANLDKVPGVDYRIALLNMNIANYDDHSDDKHISDELCVDHTSTIDKFLITCFPDFGSELDLYQGRQNALAIVGREVRKTCCYCQLEKGDNFKLKRLFCGHLMHENCLHELFQKRLLTCPDDGLELLKGIRSAFFPSMPHSPPMLIEKYQQKAAEQLKETNVTNATNLLGDRKKPNAFKIRKITAPNKFVPLELDITGKNLIKVQKPQQADSQLTTDRYSFLKYDKKGIGKTFLKPPKITQLQLIQKKEMHGYSQQYNPPLTLTGIQGTSITTNQSYGKLDVRKREYTGRDPEEEFKTYDDELINSLQNENGSKGTIGRAPSYIPQFFVDTNSDERDSIENLDEVR